MSFFRSFFFPINEKENKTLCHSLPLIQDRKVGNSQLLNTMQTFPVLLPSNEKSRERKIKKKTVWNNIHTKNKEFYSFFRF